MSSRRLRKLPLDPKRSAAVAGLQYVTETSGGIARIRKGKGFSYVDAQGRVVRDRKEIRRIQSLAIPPAWERVWICPSDSGHLQAVGYDAKGRKQYRYHPAYRACRDQTKFDRLADIAKAVAEIRKKTKEHLALPGMPKEKILATVIRVLDITGIRIGNPGSATENKTFGLTTLRNRHVEIEGSKVLFRFVGKSGVKHELEVDDKRLARIVRQCHDLPGQQLFEFVDENSEARGISSTDVNNYLRELSGQSLTAKDFRTWAGTVECAVALREAGEATSETDAKRNIVAAIRTAANRLGNRVATCRAYYVHPAVPEAYLEGELLPVMSAEKVEAEEDGLTFEERCVLDLIRRHESSQQLRKTA